MDAATWIRRLPWSLVALAILLIAIGLIGIARAEELAGGSGPFWKQQLVWSVVGLTAMMLATLPDYRRLSRLSYLFYAGSIVLLLAVFFFRPVNGAQRWIRIGPVGLQPSEFAKVAFVLALSKYLMYRENYRRLRGMWPPLLLTLVPMLLVLKEPDLGTALLFLPVLYFMLYAAGTPIRPLAVIALVGLLLTPMLWSQMSREQRSRVTALWEQSGPGERPTADGYHLHQAKRMMALGGIVGTEISGDGLDEAGSYRVPEAHTDSVYTIVVERMGAAGGALLLVLYLLLLWRGLAVADRTREPFGRLVVVGFMSLISTQAMINTGMMVGLLPITGIALPLVSYGGSSLLASGLAIGIVMNVSLRPGYEVANAPFR